MSTLDLGKKTSGGAPVNTLAPFYKRPNHIDYDLFEASDESKWLRTGVVKPDQNNEYPHATKFLGFWETGRDPLQLTGYEVEVTGVLTIPNGYVGYKLNYPETNSLELFWFDENGLFDGTVQQIHLGKDVQQTPFYDHTNQSVWCGARASSQNEPIVWKEFKDGTLTGNQFNWGSRGGDASTSTHYALITTDDPDHYFGVIVYSWLGQYDTVYCKVQKLRRSDRSVVAENKVQYTHTSSSASANHVPYIASDLSTIVVSHRYNLSRVQYKTYILDSDLKLLEQFDRSSHMALSYDFVHGEYLEAGEYKQLVNTVGVEKAKTDPDTGYPIYVKVK
ncbi:hypothetical protein DSB67_21140 [Vibrio campbellii]|uniref:hypothetical protein n=1 Tax=Vibrio campbellii TaxID=680 RepID=UPI00026C52DF|nr:hypothetical protein [Vibrio campbellii]AXB33904.1 hypothetical protein DSB67_21140 [Vibrio campbellii]